jgi:hypothetical protein
MRWAKATPLLALGVPLLLVYRDHSSRAGSGWGVVKSWRAGSSLHSSCEGATGDELLARFLFFRSRGVFTACDPLHISCSSGEATGCGACLAESSTFPTRSASGSLVVAGVDGGGQSRMVGSLGVLFVVATCFATLFGFGVPMGLSVFPGAVGRFSLSASRWLMESTAGAPSRN